MNPIEAIEREQLQTNVPDFKPGDTVRVHVKVIEGEKERIQVFAGVVIRKQPRRHPRHLHRAQGVLRRRRRAHLPDSLAAHRQDRGDRPAATCAAPSCTTCASCPVRPPASPPRRHDKRAPRKRRERRAERSVAIALAASRDRAALAASGLLGAASDVHASRAAAATRQSPSSCAPSCTTRRARLDGAAQRAARSDLDAARRRATSPSTRPSTTSVARVDGAVRRGPTRRSPACRSPRTSPRRRAVDARRTARS